MIRKIIKSSSEYYNVHIPKEYMDKRVETLVLPFDDVSEENNQEINKNTQLLEKTAGLLSSKNIDPVKWQQGIRMEVALFLYRHYRL